ncbi:MAG: RyR domain-containing protein [Coriobacteriia bacterium]|nr:RyR domain-containing protein [Coriobacteriia bacterium]
MKKMHGFIKECFDGFLADSCIDGIQYLWASLDEFLTSETKEKAFAVYESFFDCFRINLEGGSFVDLLDVLHSYEEQSSVLLDKQRDHLIHSVNVFVLGLAVYARNEHFRTYTDERANAISYEGALAHAAEEFLYRWGLAALLHDVGYPVEIINNQLRKFIAFISQTTKDANAHPFLDYYDFRTIDSIDEILYKSAFTKTFVESLPAEIELDALKPTDLLAYNYHNLLGVSFAQVQDAINTFLPTMQKIGFVDHGFYSALVLLKWYGYLIQRSGLPADVLYNPVLESAGAIFLHNYYRNVLMKPPFSLGPLSAGDHPIGYLLILCDELQEWNRTAYGIKDKLKVLAEASSVDINNESMSVHYLTSEGIMSETFGADKASSLRKVLNIPEVFSQDIKITQTTSSELYLKEIAQKDELIARPLLSNLEAMAQIIHARYVNKRVADNMSVDYPTWEDLPDTLKYSNIRQARSVYGKLAQYGFFVSDKPIEDAVEVAGFLPEQIEALARDEHDEWVAERLANGWTHGERDANKKQSPYLIPYAALTEEIKDYDRSAVRGIFPMLKQLGLHVYKK